MDLKKRILEKSRQKINPSEPDGFRRIHHRFIKEYGWISLEEFRKIPIITILGLFEARYKDMKEEEKEMKKRDGIRGRRSH